MAEAPEVKDAQKAQDARKLIAIVEDDAAITELFRDVLEFAGQWRLHFISDGEQAKNQLPELGADLILMDVGLPYLDGASLYKMLRAHNKTRTIPIVVITGSHDWELHRMGLQTGILLQKPIVIQELLSIIQALLN